MPRLKTVQKRTAVHVGGRPKFRVTTTVVDKGPLESPSIFVLGITEPALPYRDEFIRVAGVADMRDLTHLRETGLASGELIYRSSSCIQDFISVQNANTASILIKDQIDKLLASYEFFESEFEVGTEETTHPRPDPTLMMQLTQELEQLNGELEAQRKVRDDANEEFNKLTAELAQQKATCEMLKGLVDVVGPVEELVPLLETYLENDLYGAGGAQALLGQPVQPFGEESVQPYNLVFNLLNNIAVQYKDEPDMATYSALLDANTRLTVITNDLVFGNNLQSIHHLFSTSLKEDFDLSPLINTQTECATKVGELTSQQLAAREVYDAAQLEVESIQKAVNSKISEIVALCPSFEL